MKRKMKVDPRWTFCRDCVYWRALEGTDLVPANERDQTTTTLSHADGSRTRFAAASCCRWAPCRDYPQTGAGYGCGDGVKR